MPGFPRGVLTVSIDTEKHICSQCDMILNDPVQSSCGHRFCKDCLESLIRSSQKYPCSHCLREGTSEEDARITDDTSVPDFALKRELKSIPTKCVNDGCTWKGIFDDYESHEIKCTYKTKLCTHPGCSKYVQASSFKFHVEKECPFRPFYCKRCNNAVPYKFLKKHNLSECPKSEIECQYCGKKLDRDQLDAHLDNGAGDCPRAQNNSCAFSIFGCNTKLSLFTIERHLQHNVVQHLQLLCKAFQPVFKHFMLEFNSKIKQAKGKSAETTDSHSHSQSPGLDVDHLKALTSDTLLVTPSDLTSPEIQLFISNLVQQFLEVHLKSGFIPQVSGHGADKEGIGNVEEAAANSVESLATEIGKIDVNIASIVTRQGKRIQKMEQDIRILNSNGKTYQDAMTVLGDQSEVTATQLRKLQEKIKVLENDFGCTLKSVTTELALLQVTMQEVQTKIAENENATFNGVMVWKISDYTRKRREAVEQGSSLYSPIFYSGPHGYKMCCRLFLNGDGVGKGTHFSVFFMLLHGKHDAILHWPFKQTVKFMLIDQNNYEHILDGFKPEQSSSSFQRPKSERNIPTGCPLFITPQEVEKSRNAYIRDDCMFIRVSVEPK